MVPFYKTFFLILLFVYSIPSFAQKKYEIGLKIEYAEFFNSNGNSMFPANPGFYNSSSTDKSHYVQLSLIGEKKLKDEDFVRLQISYGTYSGITTYTNDIFGGYVENSYSATENISGIILGYGKKAEISTFNFKLCPQIPLLYYSNRSYGTEIKSYNGNNIFDYQRSKNTTSASLAPGIGVSLMSSALFFKRVSVGIDLFPYFLFYKAKVTYESTHIQYDQSGNITLNESWGGTAKGTDTHIMFSKSLLITYSF